MTADGSVAQLGPVIPILLGLDRALRRRPLRHESAATEGAT